MRVLLFDAPVARVGESLLPSARTILAELGLWSRFVEQNHLPCYGNLSAWGSATLAETDFMRSPYGHGWHLDRVRFDTMLRDAASEAGTVVRNTRYVHGEESARWLVDCGGRNAPIARALGIARHYEDKLVAYYARFTSRDEDSRTLVESHPEGWFHTALLPGGERIVTFFTEGRDRLLSLLPTTLHISLRVLDVLSPVRSTDARTSRLERFHGENWIAAGDAATTFDPLSSQGILNALYGGLKAAKAVLSGELDEYDDAIARVYEQFLVNRARYYAMEPRWSDQPFWAGRRGAGS